MPKYCPLTATIGKCPAVQCVEETCAWYIPERTVTNPYTGELHTTIPGGCAVQKMARHLDELSRE